jgi:hypothetical protein
MCVPIGVYEITREEANAPMPVSATPCTLRGNPCVREQYRIDGRHRASVAAQLAAPSHQSQESSEVRVAPHRRCFRVR